MIKNIIKRIKRFFRKEKSISICDDKNIEWMGDQICLTKKNYPELEIKLEPTTNKYIMMLSSRQIKEGMFEVNGVIMYADTLLEAQRKYLRKKK